MYVYDTVSEAINDLRKRGYTMDFNLAENSIVCNDDTCNPDDLEIVEIYRFEGDTDPADQAVVYAIESKSGLKGVLVSGYGISADAMSAKMVEKLNIRKP